MNLYMSLIRFWQAEKAVSRHDDLALGKAKQADVLETLTYCRNNHMARVALLTGHVLSCGSTPNESTGIWGSLESSFKIALPLSAMALRCWSKLRAERLVNYESQSVLVIGPVRACIKRMELLPAQHENAPVSEHSTQEPALQTQAA